MLLWIRRDTWVRETVSAVMAFSTEPDGRVTFGPPQPGALATVMPFMENGVPRATLITHNRSAVTLNGYAPLPVAILEDRDEMTVCGTSFYFGAFSPAVVTSFPHTDTDTRCARCKSALQPGDAALRCPACGAWHHEGAISSGGERPCWSYDPTCGGCGRVRDAIVWTPEDSDD